MEKNSRGKREKTSPRKVVRIAAGRKSIVLGVTGSIAAYKSAELAHGLADHPLAAIALATGAPILLAPAMNGKMWQHPATVENVEKLQMRGVEFIGPEEGMLACGYEGIGRLWKVNDIAFRAEFLLARQDNLIASDFSSRLGPRASRSIRFVTFPIVHRAKWAMRLQTRHSKPGTMSF